jgi:hypothetical protein
MRVWLAACIFAEAGVAMPPGIHNAMHEVLDATTQMACVDRVHVHAFL